MNIYSNISKKRRVKNMLVRVFCLVLSLVVLILSFSATASATTIRTKKVVSIVYDDSGSMLTKNPPKWAYTNYAMQSFAGMLNKDDTLYISYMSNPSKIINVDLSNKLKEVDVIRNHIDSDGTPFSAVEKAYSALKNHKNKDATTQYWLVIMTDGQFTDKSMDAVEGRLKQIADSKMSNGTQPKIIYMSMCDTDNKHTPKDSLHKNITIKPAKKAEDIMSTFSEICDQISGRYKVSPKDITVVDKRTIKVKSDLPLHSIGVLTQNSTAKLISVDFAEGKGNFESNVPLKYPEADGRSTDKDLVGNVAIVNNADLNIPADTYTLKFSEDIMAENLNVMFEPAFELRIILNQDENEITDLSCIEQDSIISAKAILYESGTDNKIDLNLLPSGITTSISAIEDGKVVKNSAETELIDITLSNNTMDFEASFVLEGYFNLSTSLSITPVNTKIVKMTADIFYDGTPREGDDPENMIYSNKLKENKTGVLFYLYTEDEKINKDRAAGMLTKFKNGLSTGLEPVGIEVQDDGGILVYPKKAIVHSNLLYRIKYEGQQTISCNLDGVSASGDLIIKTPLLSVVMEIYILWIILGIIERFFAYKFSGIEIKCSSINLKGSISTNPFKDAHENITVLKRHGAPFLKLMLILCPIPILREVFLLSPAKKRIDGCKFMAVATSRSGNYKLVGLSGCPYTMNPVLNSRDLPKKNTQNLNEVNIGESGQIVVNEGGGKYVKIVAKKL